ncbi:MAG: helix-turn-helix domain-containing protein, partial [Oscillospiraceae bacterium]|nr:helix-turn-helix domain-containing protein [Oscillospiraceae bacterium]
DLQNLLDYIDTHYIENITLEYAADRMNFSPSYFSRSFRKAMDENFVSYVNRIKIEHAVDMLKNGNKSINTIAEDLGYTDASYFIKVFKRYTGTTPLSYRRRGFKYDKLSGSTDILI